MIFAGYLRKQLCLDLWEFCFEVLEVRVHRRRVERMSTGYHPATSLPVPWLHIFFLSFGHDI